MQFVDMSQSEEQAQAYNGPTPPGKLAKYPYGLCISFCSDELEKLDLDINDIEIGDFLHLHALAKVTSKSTSDLEDGTHNDRMELVLAFVEVEDEGEEDDQAERDVPSKLYNNRK